MAYGTVYIFGGFLKWGYLQFIHCNIGFSWIFHEINYPAIGVAPFMDKIFHYKPSISGYSSPPSMEAPFIDCFIDYPLVNQR